MKEIWVYSESAPVSNELATAASELARVPGWRAVVLELDSPRDGVFSPSGKLVLRAESRIAGSADTAAHAIVEAATKLEPVAILVGSTRLGRELAARLAVRLGRGCLSEAFDLSTDGAYLSGKRYVYAGRVVASVSAPVPCIATVKLGSYSQLADGSSEADEMHVGGAGAGLKVLDVRRKQASAVDLKSAKVIVSAGRGIRKKEDLELIEKLASAVGGAVGCSRPLSSDLGWLPEEHHIGLTGVTVHPDLYLAVGISGQLQHVAGIKDSKVIAAINSDRDAPIFQASDYGAVGDLYKIVPEMLKILSGS